MKDVHQFELKVSLGFGLRFIGLDHNSDIIPN